MILGTAQFGFSYAGSKPNFDTNELQYILDAANDLGFRTIDTAADYGDSELRLGQCNIQRYSINTKLPAYLPSTFEDLENSLMKSIEKLQVDFVDTLFIHDTRFVSGKNHIDLLNYFFNVMKEKNRIRKVGVSIYDPSELIKFKTGLNLDVIQAPFNFFDNRIIKYFESTSDYNNCAVQYRSIFLQGLLLNSQRKEADIFKDLLHTFYHAKESRKYENYLDFCVDYCRQHIDFSNVVIGVNNMKELMELRNSLGRDIKSKIPMNHYEIINKILVNPFMWPK